MKMTKCNNGAVVIKVFSSHWYYGSDFCNFIGVFDSDDDNDNWSFKDLAIEACKRFDPSKIYEEYEVEIKWCGFHDYTITKFNLMSSDLN